MKKKVFLAATGIPLLLAIIILIVIGLTPTVAAATVKEIGLDKNSIESRIKEKILANEPVELDNVVVDLVEEQIVLNKIKGTSLDITEEEYDSMRKSAQDNYYKNKEDNDAFLKKYNMSKEENEELMVSMSIRTIARGRYMTLIADELISDYKQTYGEEQSVDSAKLLELFNQHLEQLRSELPEVTYNSGEINKMIASIETWKQNINDSIVLPDIELSY